MKRIVLLTLLAGAAVFACGRPSIGSNDSISKPPTPKTEGTSRVDTEDLWIPRIVENCLGNVVSPEPIELESSYNPFYLRADLDGNQEVDYVLLVRSKAEKRNRGVIICKDSKESLLYGTIAQPGMSYPDTSDNNFVTNNWEILSKEETKEIIKESDGNKLGDAAQGESVAFLFEGGGVFIYWNGKEFVRIGGA